MPEIVSPIEPKTRRIWWVLPAYNEAASIEDLLDRIAEVSSEQEWDYRVIVVDDGSADETGDLARAKAAAGLPVEVLRNEPNQGLGYTIRRGLREASSRADADDAIVTLDADLTQDPIYAPSMVAQIEHGYDVAIASRYQPGAGVEGVPPFRVFLSRAASLLVALVRPIPGVRDYSCGFRAYRAGVIDEGFDEHGDDFVSERGFACMMEIAQRLRGKASFIEVPFVLRYDEKRKGSEIKIVPTIGAYARVIAKVAKTRRKPVPVVTLAVAFTAVITSSVAQLFLRQGAKGLGDLSIAETLAGALTQPIVLIGLLMYSVASALWLGVLSRMELAVAYPLGASGYVLVVVLAAVAGEIVPPLRWLGVLLIVMGVLLVSWLGVAPVKKVVGR
ncbi:MAG: glycosyltransferase [Coriobacteriales bacterium]|nr:glycosyltransferase [Coriobacteriales bacterium]